MNSDKKLDPIEGGMVTPPKPSKKKNEKSPDYTFRSQPSKNNPGVKPAHDPERFNRVLKETEQVKERASVLIDPDIVARLAIAVVFFLIYFFFFR